MNFVTEGTSIGGLVGLATALMTYLYLFDYFGPPNQNPTWWQRTFGSGGPAAGKFAAEIVSLIAVWKVNEPSDMDLVQGYLVALEVVYILLMILPVYMLLRRLQKVIGG